MENHPLSVWNSTFEDDDFLYEPLACQFPPSVHHLSNVDDSYHQSYQCDQLTLPDSYLPFMNPHETLLIEPAPLSIQDYGSCDVPSTWTEGGPSAKAALSSGNNEEGTIERKKKSKRKKYRKKKKVRATMLTREQVSQYFYMPIIQAAKELKVSLTSLKIRCRELGIQRWPRRKLESLQNLIDHIQEQGKEFSNDKKRTAIEALEIEKSMVEVMPDLELDDHTIWLRKTCSKANYKRKRRMRIQETPNSSRSARLESHKAKAVTEDEGSLQGEQVELMHAYPSRAEPENWETIKLPTTFIPF